MGNFRSIDDQKVIADCNIEEYEFELADKIRSTRIFFVLFTASWANKSKHVNSLFCEKIIESIKRDGQIVDIEKYHVAAGYFGITTVPSLVIFENGTPIIHRFGEREIKNEIGRPSGNYVEPEPEPEPKPYASPLPTSRS